MLTGWCVFGRIRKSISKEVETMLLNDKITFRGQEINMDDRDVQKLTFEVKNYIQTKEFLRKCRKCGVIVK